MYYSFSMYTSSLVAAIVNCCNNKPLGVLSGRHPHLLPHHPTLAWLVKCCVPLSIFMNCGVCYLCCMNRSEVETVHGSLLTSVLIWGLSKYSGTVLTVLRKGFFGGASQIHFLFSPLLRFKCVAFVVFCNVSNSNSSNITIVGLFRAKPAFPAIIIFTNNWCIYIFLFKVYF